MTINNDIQLTINFQTTTNIIKHLPNDIIDQHILLMKQQITKHNIKTKKLHTKKHIINHKLTTIQHL